MRKTNRLANFADNDLHWKIYLKIHNGLRQHPLPIARSQYSAPPLYHQHQHQQRLQVHHSASAVVPYPPSPMPEVAMNLQQRISAYEDARARIASSQRLAQAAQAAGQHRPATTGAHTSAENALPPQPYRKASPLEVLAPQSSFIEFRVNLGGTNFDISTPATEADKCRAKAQKEAQKKAGKKAKKKAQKASLQNARTQTGKIRSPPVVAEVAEESQRVVAAVVLERSPSGTDSPTPAEPYRPSEKALGKRKAVDNSPGVDGGECLDGDLPDETEESTESELVFKAEEHSAKETPSSNPYPECNCAGVEHEVSCILDMAFASRPSPPTTMSADAVGAGTTVEVADFPALNYLAEGQHEPPYSSAHLEEISLQEGEFEFEYWPVSSMF
ncbi:hypothetical protein NLJ89_g409 [Agrocybe chaxingu]|uniref:Uncharacterized protein n=1 Tax=Agrocybe chaxingu TaxID=84603 RepID=A0A9W8TG32_9AGAR|nr:hypothetical protein NLJ89_g409 [Agrocybe chaxingu]